MTAAIHDWCGRLDDPAGLRCPCASNTTTAFEVEVRTRKAIRAAHESTRSRRVPADPTGRKWAA